MSNFRGTNAMIQKIVDDLSARPIVPLQVPGSVFAELCLDEQKLLQGEVDRDWERMQNERFADHYDDIEPDDDLRGE
jgi:hypothetical protein